MQSNKYLLYKLSNLEGLGAKTLSIILERAKAKNRTLEDIFNLSEKEFQNLFPDFGKGRFTKINHLSHNRDNRFAPMLIISGLQHYGCY